MFGCGRILTTVAICIGILFVATGPAQAVKLQTNVSEEGWNVQAYSGLMQSPAGYTSVEVDLFAPDLTIVGSSNDVLNSPYVAVDVRRPWAWVRVVTRDGLPPAGTVTHTCTFFMNVSRVRLPPNDYVDLYAYACGDDPNGFDSYSVSLGSRTEVPVPSDESFWWFPALSAGTDQMFRTGEVKRKWRSNVQVCGWAETASDCMSVVWPTGFDGSGTLREVGRAAVTYASTT